MDSRKKYRYSYTMEQVLETLQLLPAASYIYGHSALDRYFSVKDKSLLFVATTASLIELAKVFNALYYPGTDYGDAAVDLEGGTVYFRTVDSVNELDGCRVLPMTFRYDIGRRRYQDPAEVYGRLRQTAVPIDRNFRYPFTWEEIGMIAVLLSRYHYQTPEQMVPIGEPVYPLPVDDQRIVLSLVLTGTRAREGMQFLADSGFIDVHWPELSALEKTDHSKEYHPEGNVWEHTLSALDQRKTLDLSLGLGLLLHDIGKPDSIQYEGNQFHNHAQIGSHTAARFIESLGFSDQTAEDVHYLVQYHMMPAAIDRLPPYKTEKIVSSDLFPSLLELFRCDLASSFRNLDKYYHACKWYRRYRKNQNNPYRSADGKKTRRLSSCGEPVLPKSI